MLKRDRQIRTVIHQLADATLFAVAFWVAYALRADPHIIAWLKLEPTSPFESFALLYLVLIPAAPLVLESQEFMIILCCAPAESCCGRCSKVAF